MTEVEPTGLSTLIQSKKEKWRSIRASRKRKLHEVYCVATQVDALPLIDPIADTSQLANTEESKFHNDNAFLQGPFLNERYLPPRRISPYGLPTPHDASRATETDGPAFGPSKKSKSPEEESVGITSPIQRPNGLPPVAVDARAATPLTSTTALSKSIEAPARSVTQDATAETTQVPDDTRNKQSSQFRQTPGSGAVTTVDARPSEELLASRIPTHGREVSFVEPQKRPSVPEVPLATAAHAGVQSKHHVPNTDTMEVDETAGRTGDLTRLTVLRPPPVDAPRPADILSSPGSTAQTATTPAVHDGSPDTSPDNEGPHFPGDEDDESEEHKSNRDQVDGTAHRESVAAAEALDSGGSRAASAQLLQESVNAASSIQTLVPDTPCSPQDNNIDSQELRPTAAFTATEKAVPEDKSSSISQSRELEPNAQTSTPSSHLQTTSAAQQVDSRPVEMKAEVQIPVPASREPTPATSPPVPLSSTGLDSSERDAEVPAIDTNMTVANNERLSDHGYEEEGQAITTLATRKRLLTGKRGFKHKRASTVVFEKRSRKQDETIVASQSQNRPFRIPTDDYFVPLFFDGFTRQSSWMKSPEQLLGNTHKTLSSSDCQIVLQENQACKVLRRIYHLQQHDKWSLRQPKRCPEPTRQATTWDTLLQEMSWMRSDFREERKWKRAIARNLAEACAEWVSCSAEERKYLQVKAAIPPRVETLTADGNNPHSSEPDGLPTPIPDLVYSDGADSPMDIDEEPQDWKMEPVAPSAIFALPDEEVVFPLQRTAASDLLLEELPLYGAPLRNAKAEFAMPDFDPDAAWRRPALPLTKYVEGELVLKPAGPKLRQSRFNYTEEEEEDEFEVAGSHVQEETTKIMPPQNADVALFRPEMKAIRDRLHAGHQFRPPTESLMPSQSFYENRLASTWTATEDEELRRQVREYSYNWSLISKNISSTSLFISAEDRRTPWECFERWVQLEGFPNDVARTQYFQTYQRRIDSAQRAIAQANENARPQVSANGTVTPVQRRRPTLPIRVERKPQRRHFATIDAMKKLAKKREATAAKQQQTANNQNRRTSTENAQQKLPTKTPEDYSRLRHEREKQMHEKLLRFTQQQQEAQRQQAMQGRVQAQMGRVAATPGTAQAVQNSPAAAHAANVANPLTARLQAQGQTRPRIPMQQQNVLAAQMAAGGLVPPMPVNVNGMSQAQLAALQAQRMQMPDANLVMQARRVQEQQRRQQAAQQAAHAQAQAQVHQLPQQQGQQQQPQQPLQQQQQQQPQIPPQHSPQPQPQPQAQAVQQQPQQNHTMPNGSAAQTNSPVIRNGMNGINQSNYMMNNMTAYTPNGMGMAGFPSGVGMNMQNIPAGVPRPPMMNQPRGLPPSMQAQFAEIENQVRAKNPNLTQDQSRQIAFGYIRKLSQNSMAKTNVAQNAMDAAAGSPPQQQAFANGIPNASSPQQYAQLLRQHQQQQAADIAAAAQAGQQHQRQPSDGATPTQSR